MAQNEPVCEVAVGYKTLLTDPCFFFHCNVLSVCVHCCDSA